MKRLIMLLPLVGLFSLYVGHLGYQEKKSVVAKIAKLEQIIQFKDNELNRYQAINEHTSIMKVKAENKSIERTRQLKDALKNHLCTHERVPDPIASKLYNRAYQIRQSATHSGKFSQ